MMLKSKEGILLPIYLGKHSVKIKEEILAGIEMIWRAAATTYDQEERMSILQMQGKELENWKEKPLMMMVQATPEVLEGLPDSFHR